MISDPKQLRPTLAREKKPEKHMVSQEIQEEKNVPQSEDRNRVGSEMLRLLYSRQSPGLGLGTQGWTLL